MAQDGNGGKAWVAKWPLGTLAVGRKRLLPSMAPWPGTQGAPMATAQAVHLA